MKKTQYQGVKRDSISAHSPRTQQKSRVYSQYRAEVRHVSMYLQLNKTATRQLIALLLLASSGLITINATISLKASKALTKQLISRFPRLILHEPRKTKSNYKNTSVYKVTKPPYKPVHQRPVYKQHIVNPSLKQVHNNQKPLYKPTTFQKQRPFYINPKQPYEQVQYRPPLVLTTSVHHVPINHFQSQEQTTNTQQSTPVASIYSGIHKEPPPTPKQSFYTPLAGNPAPYSPPPSLVSPSYNSQQSTYSPLPFHPQESSEKMYHDMLVDMHSLLANYMEKTHIHNPSNQIQPGHKPAAASVAYQNQEPNQFTNPPKQVYNSQSSPPYRFVQSSLPKLPEVIFNTPQVLSSTDHQNVMLASPQYDVPTKHSKTRTHHQLNTILDSYQHDITPSQHDTNIPPLPPSNPYHHHQKLTLEGSFTPMHPSPEFLQTQPHLLSHMREQEAEVLFSRVPNPQVGKSQKLQLTPSTGVTHSNLALSPTLPFLEPTFKTTVQELPSSQDFLEKELEGEGEGQPDTIDMMLNAFSALIDIEEGEDKDEEKGSETVTISRDAAMAKALSGFSNVEGKDSQDAEVKPLEAVTVTVDQMVAALSAFSHADQADFEAGGALGGRRRRKLQSQSLSTRESLFSSSSLLSPSASSSGPSAAKELVAFLAVLGDREEEKKPTGRRLYVGTFF